jgi:hypothetical protein
MRLQDIIKDRPVNEGEFGDMWDKGLTEVKKFFNPEKDPDETTPDTLDGIDLKQLKSALFNVLEKRPLEYGQEDVIKKVYKKL